MTPTTYGRDFAYCLKSHGGVRGFNASLWQFLLRCTLFCHSVATFLTSVSSYEGGCGFEDVLILCETTPLIFNRTKESLLFPIPLFSIVFFISIESISMLFCIYSPNSLYKYSVVKKKRPLNGTIFIISCNERIIASCSFNLTFNTSTL